MPYSDLFFPPRFADLKRDIANSYPEFEQRATKAWKEIIEQLNETTAAITKEGSEYIPQVKFSELSALGEDEIKKIRQRGTVVIKDIVDDDEAISWRKDLEELIKTNPGVEGFPLGNEQFFQLYWTKSQVRARSHPNLLAATTWLNQLYHAKSGEKIEGVDLSTPLTYADRFRIRHPGTKWSYFPPHVDGGTIERWEDLALRNCFDDILSGEWRRHDPYELEGRLNARTSLYDRPNQCSVFRTFQGWLSMSETAPTEGTLKVFPDVGLSNAYLILRPFFRPVVPVSDPGIFDAKNWQFDTSSSDFPGILYSGKGYEGPKPTPELHPHLRLKQTMTSVPKVYPGDAVFWHCDVVHSVEAEHTGKSASAVMYIPAVPLTPKNKAYIEKQKERFLGGNRPSDFPQGISEANFIGVATVEDIVSAVDKANRPATWVDKLEMQATLRRLAESVVSGSVNLREVLYPPIPLYRRLLRAHRFLPSDMRSLGDDYVKAEFRRHREVTNPVHIMGFLTQWNLYLDELPKGPDGNFSGKRLDPTVFEKMSDEQLGQLYELMHATKDLWKPVERS
ncbi:hypothetical protein AX15_006697 [Amanita polypyramis BW_CC]|nr:hypothetical protein AX15_006697 [Amanita polypyramis BW_CC]